MMEERRKVSRAVITGLSRVAIKWITMSVIKRAEEKGEGTLLLFFAKGRKEHNS